MMCPAEMGAPSAARRRFTGTLACRAARAVSAWACRKAHVVYGPFVVGTVKMLDVGVCPEELGENEAVVEVD